MPLVIGWTVSKKDGEIWTFAFIHQNNLDKNTFRVVNDVAQIYSTHVFAEIDTPAPTSSSRAKELKFSDKNFTYVTSTFENSYA